MIPCFSQQSTLILAGLGGTIEVGTGKETQAHVGNSITFIPIYGIHTQAMLARDHPILSGRIVSTVKETANSLVHRRIVYLGERLHLEIAKNIG